MSKFKIEVALIGEIEAESEDKAIEWLENNAEEFLLKARRYIEYVEKIECNSSKKLKIY